MDTILTATDKLFGSMGDTPEMVKQARILAQVRILEGYITGHCETMIEKRQIDYYKFHSQIAWGSYGTVFTDFCNLVYQIQGFVYGLGNSLQYYDLYNEKIIERKKKRTIGNSSKIVHK